MVTKDDFVVMTWEEYQVQVEKIVDSLKKENRTFDFIVPIMRGGMPLAISLSHCLGTIHIMPVQYQYDVNLINDEREVKLMRSFSSIASIKEKDKPYDILVTEGNHCRGKTAQSCIDHIKSELPQCHIVYASLGRDYTHQNRLIGTDFETWGYLTNEDGSLSVEECVRLNIPTKFTVYPWETIEGEMRDINGY